MQSAEFRQTIFGCNLDAVPDSHIQWVLDYVERNYCPLKCWKTKQPDGIAALTAHLLSSQVEEFSALGAMGANSSEGKNFTPRSQLADTSDASLMRTMPGVEFVKLREHVVNLTMRTAIY